MYILDLREPLKEEWLLQLLTAIPAVIETWRDTSYEMMLMIRMIQLVVFVVVLPRVHSACRGVMEHSDHKEIEMSRYQRRSTYVFHYWHPPKNCCLDDRDATEKQRKEQKAPFKYIKQRG